LRAYYRTVRGPRKILYGAAGNTTGYASVTASYNNWGRLKILTQGGSTGGRLLTRSLTGPERQPGHRE